jgi:2-iminobutanoate/2-iminopropanoate deaminase
LKNIAREKVFVSACIATNLCGMPGPGPTTGKITSNNFEDQARQCFLKIKTLLEEAGSSLIKVIRTAIFINLGYY